MKINLKYLIVLLLIVSIYTSIDSYIGYKNAKELNSIIENEHILNNFFIQGGRERDLSAIYLASKGFYKMLKRQRLIVDKEIELLSHRLNIESREKLDRVRARVDMNSSNFQDIFFKDYGNIFISPFESRLDGVDKLSDSIKILYLISLIREINIAKNSVGLERGFVTYFMEKRVAMSSRDREIWDSLKIKSNIHIPLNSLDYELKDAISLLYNSKVTEEMLLNIDDISMGILVDADSGEYKAKTADWFTLETQKITLLSKIELLILSELEENLKRYTLQRGLILTLFLIFLSIIMIASSWYIYTQFIKSREIPPIIEGEDKHFEAFITLLTKISYSDGVITNLEKDVINYTMNSFISIGKKQGMDSIALVALKDNLNNAYRLARRDSEPFIKYASQLYDCSFDLKVQLLKQLISMASIEGYKARKKMMIYEAVEAIGFDKLKIQKYINDIIGKEWESEDELNPYEILGCSLSDTDETIKKIYMKQIKAFHPDYIKGKGLNDEIIKFAEEKLKRFNNAYDEIKKSRK